MNIETVIYESQNPIKPGREFLAFIVVEANELDGKKPTGRKVKDQLAVTFYGTSATEADAKARKFWEEETAKAKARVERGRALGSSRKKL